MSASRRVLLLLKPLDVYPMRPHAPPKSPSSSFLAQKNHELVFLVKNYVCHPITWLMVEGLNDEFVMMNAHILSYLKDRVKVHKETINFCKDVLRRKSINWEPLLRNNLSQPVRNVDLVITVGGDGTLLQASHFLDDSVPVLGVNSDPTQADEVNSFSNEFDATRSTGYLCAATARNFEQVLDEILEGHKLPSQLSRISVSLNGHRLPTYALNDILAAHPCPASVSRFSFRIKRDAEMSSPLVNCRSSGLRVSTAAGSTAAMLSAGGFRMPSSSNVLQYMVREPISLGHVESSWLHGLIEPDQSMQIAWYNQEGVIYFDGSHVQHSIQHGDSIELSALAPILKVYLSHRESTNDLF